MTMHMPRKPELENHSDEQLNRLYLTMNDALAEALADLARRSSDPSANDLVSVHDALKKARLGQSVDPGGLNQALELLVETQAGKRPAPGFRDIAKAAYPEKELLVADLAGSYLENGQHTCIADAIEAATDTLKRARIL